MVNGVFSSGTDGPGCAGARLSHKRHKELG